MYSRTANALLSTKKNQLFSGEKHGAIVDSDGIHPAQYLGPGTKLETRIKRGDKGLSEVDKIAKVHDLKYALAKDVDDVRKADRHMIKKVSETRQKGTDNAFNLAQADLIRAKIMLEEYGILPRDFFSNVEKKSLEQNPELQDLYKQEHDRMVMLGYGLYGGCDCKDKKKGGKFYDDEDDEIKLYAKLNQEAQKTADKRKSIKPYTYVEADSNREVAVYIDKTDKVLCLVYRGTDFDVKSDVLADVAIGVGNVKLSKKYRDLKKHFLDMISKYKYRVILTGHSLGGAISTALYDVCKDKKGVNDCRFIVYNRGSSPMEIHGKMSQDYKRRKHVYTKEDTIATPFLEDTKTKHILMPTTNKKNAHSLSNYV
jgi:transcription antitermination factor NusG